MIPRIFSVTFLCLFYSSAASFSNEYVFHHEHILGTNMQLNIHVERVEVAKKIEQEVLQEIDRLKVILSGYESDSEFSKWNGARKHSIARISRELGYVLERAEHWRVQTKGAFDVRANQFGELWKQSLTVAANDTDQKRRRVVGQLKSPPFRFLPSTTENNPNGARLIERLDELTLSIDALAKGYVLDRVVERVQKFRDLKGFAVNIGGDIRKIGVQKIEFVIANPFDSHVNSKPLVSLNIEKEIAMATSGNYFRRLEGEEGSASHIFDPRVGLPVERIASVTVFSPSAIDADALATAVSVMGVKEGLSLVNQLSDTECLIVSSTGEIACSTNWPKQNQLNRSINDDEKTESGLVVEFKLNRPKGRRYRRPYVAVWMEDEEGFPVKTALLFLQTEQPGPRWHRDLTRWYRHDRTRKLVEKTDVIKTVASATRGPGSYSAKFDGKDNAGKPLPGGKYTLCLEVAREHGTYQIIREKIDFVSTQKIDKTKLKSNVEVSEVSYSFKPE